MKTILFPTDFSENSLKAFDFAMRYLSGEGTEFILLNVYQIPAGNVSGTFYLLEELKSQAEKEMIALIRQLEKKYADKALKISSKVLEGDFEVQCNAIAKNYEADCIIMGSKGASGIKEVLIGSNTASIMKSLQVPLYVVPFAFLEKKMDEFVLSYDGMELTERAGLLVKKFAQWFKLPVKAVHIKLEKDKAIENWAPIASLFEGLPFKHEELAAEDLESTLQNLVREENGILCMIRHKKSFWENLFNVSDSRKAVMHANLPILVIPE